MMQACFRRHESLDFGRARITLREGGTIGGLTPAPRFRALWQRPESTAREAAEVHRP